MDIDKERAAKPVDADCWISVDDRLPEINQRVVGKNKTKVVTTHRHREERTEGGNNAIFYDESSAHKGGLITHWMPLYAMLNKEEG